MYEVTVNGLHVYAYHGVSANEQELGHRITFDVSAWVEGGADRTDDVADTVDYIRLASAAQSVSDGQRFRTLEALTRTVGERVLSQFPSVTKVRVRAVKPLPPAPVIADSVGVTMIVERHAT